MHTTERERKFLVETRPANLSRYPHALIEQGYLAIARERDPASEVRIRRTGARRVLTVKRGEGEARKEREIPLSRQHAQSLWPLTKDQRIEKIRYRIPYNGLTIELDVYRGKLSGLVVAEVEFPSQRAMLRFEPPSWFGREVTGNRRYANSRLALTGSARARRSS